MNNKKSGVSQKHYTNYKFDDHLWNITVPKNTDMLELARRCVKVDGAYYMKQSGNGHWNVFQKDVDAIKEAVNTWTGGKLSSGSIIDDDMVNSFFSGKVDAYVGKTKSTVVIGSCPNIQHTMVIPIGPEFVVHDNKKYLNLWHDDMIMPNVEKVALGKLMLELVYRSLCNGEQLHDDVSEESNMLLEQVLSNNYTNKDFRFCINWLAAIYQTPGVNLQTNLWFCGEQQGIGKGTLVDVMRKIIGDSYVGELNQTEIEAGWNDHLMGKVLISSNEFDTDGKMKGKGWNKWIKAHCNDPTLNIRQRNTTARKVLNIGNYIFTSNDENPLYLDKTDRRNHLIKTTDDNYWKEFAAVIQTQYIQNDIGSVAAGFAWILEQVKVDQVFVNTSFINSLKASIIASSQNGVEEWLSHDPLITKGEFVGARILYDEYKIWVRTSAGTAAEILSETMWGRLMGKAAASGVDKKRAKDGMKYYVGVAPIVCAVNRDAIGQDIGRITQDTFDIKNDDCEIVMPVAPVLSKAQRMRERLLRDSALDGE